MPNLIAKESTFIFIHSVAPPVELSTIKNPQGSRMH
jgi:hypothetical protein